MKCMNTVRKAAPWVCVLLAVLMLVPTLPVATRAADSGLDVSYMKTVYTETFDGKKLPALQAGNPAPSRASRRTEPIPCNPSLSSPRRWSCWAGTRPRRAPGHCWG